MASESGSIDLSNFLLDVPTHWDQWYADLCTSYSFSLDSSCFEDAPPSQNISEPPPPSLSPTGEIHPDFFPEILPEVPPIQTLQQSVLPSPSAASGTGAKLCITCGKRSSVVVPAMPPPAPPSLPAAAFPLNRIKIPQKSYDQGRNHRNFKPLEPISFSTNGRPGMNLRDALRKEFSGLDGRDDQMLQGVGGAISCRLLFPGYPDNGRSCQIHTLNWTRNRLPISRSKLAQEVAKKLERYLNHMARVALDETVEDRWRIGKGFMHIDNMFLVSLVSVSKGSFQPEIWVVDPSVPPIDVGRK